MMDIKITSPAEAYWNQRLILSACSERISALSKAVDSPTDLSLFQWAQLIAFSLEFKPDIIIELGRAKGNSTCAFTEVANLLKPKSCKVLSLCRTYDWERITKTKVRRIVPISWFEPLIALQTNILTFHYEDVLKDHERILVFWDAHGFEVAECVLGNILPLIADRPHVVIMHDFSDARYAGSDKYEYGLWKGGNSGTGPRLRLNYIDSAVEQSVAILDFTTRNKLPLHSAEHSFAEEFGKNPAKMKEIKNIIGEELFSLKGRWFWFSLNEIEGPYKFPNFIKPVEIRRTFSQRLYKAVSILLGWERF
jgi:hypothetical protein